MKFWGKYGKNGCNFCGKQYIYEDFDMNSYIRCCTKCTFSCCQQCYETYQINEEQLDKKGEIWEEGNISGNITLQ